MDKALILSVGGTVEPLARTLAEHQPCGSPGRRSRRSGGQKR